MNHDELKTVIEQKFNAHTDLHDAQIVNALYRVVELHTPTEAGLCEWCTCRDCQHLVDYPCKTIQKIESELP